MNSTVKKYSLLHSQLGVFVACMQFPDCNQYNLPTVAPLGRDVDLDRLEQAFHVVYNSRVAWRIRFGMDEQGYPYQYADDTKVFRVVRRQMSDAELQQYAHHEFIRPFDLMGDEPLVRVELVTTEVQDYLLVDVSHLIQDGVSYGQIVLHHDIPAAYRDGVLPEETYTMLDAVTDEQAALGGQAYMNAKAYYDEKYGDTVFATLSINQDNPLGEMIRAHEYVDKAEVDGWCKEHGVAVNLLFQAAFSYVMHVLLREDKIAYTTVSHGRFDKRWRSILGMYTRQMPILSELKADMTVLDFIKGFRGEQMSTIRYAAYPITDLCRDQKKDLGVSFNFQAIEGLEETWYIGDREYPFFEPDRGAVTNDIAVFIFPDERGYDIRMESSAAMNSQETINMVDHAIYEVLLKMMAQPDALIKSLSLVGEEERQAIIAKSAGKRMELDFTKTYLDHFIARAAQCPDSLAVADGRSQLTYRQLDNYSNRIAHLLLEKGVKKHDFIGVMIERSKEFPVCVFGIHKAGGAYLPLDIEYPNERLQYMLEDSGAHVLITTHAVLEEKRKEGSFNADTIIYLDDMDWEEGDMTPVNLCTPDCYTYIIYTSGSTGKPKGVVLHHKGLLNYIFSTIDELHLTAEDRISSHRSFSFDSHIEDLYAILLLGGSLHIMPEEIRKNLQAIYDFVVEHRITGGGYTTSIATMLANTFDMPVRYLSAIGEKLMGVVSRDAQIINAYGPTECTDHITIHYLEKDKEYKDIPIGHVIANNWCFIVDAAGQLVPMGACGELCIAGIQVGVGYWKLPERTAQSFVDCPFVEQNVDGTPVRMYHTGDLARYNEQGELECLGRIDNQVKLRGYRVELGEIETEAMKVDGIQQAVAMIRDINADKHLVLYYTVDEGKNVDEAVLDEFMKHSNLPSYMVPEVYMFMEAMPRTPNGKINRRALPEPQIGAEQIVIPETEMEQRLFDMVAEVLKHNQFGVTTNMLTVGMTSLTAMRLSAMIQQKLEVTLPTKTIMQTPTIREMAGQVEHGELKNETTAQVHAMREYYPLTENQRGVYVDWEMNRDTTQYNIPYVQKLDDVDADTLQSALERVIAAHPILKARLAMAEGEIRLQRRDDAELSILKVELPSAPDSEFLQKRIRPFDLFHDDLSRFEIYTVSSDGDSHREVYLFMDIHHIIYDGGSAVVFLSDLHKALTGKELKSETYTAFDRALDEKAWEESEAFAKAEHYFDALMEDCEVASYPPASTPDTCDPASKTVSLQIPSTDIRNYCREHGVTESAFFMAVTCQVLHRILREESIMCTTIHHGRDHARMQEIIGMFVKTLPLVSHTGNDTFLATSKAMMQQYLDSQEHALYGYTRLVERHGKRAEIMIDYQLEGDPDFMSELEGESITLDTVKMPLTVSVVPMEKEYLLSIEYDSSIYGQHDMQILSKSIKAFALNAICAADRYVKDIKLVSKEDEQALITLGKGITMDYDKSKTLVDLVMHQAQEHPDAIAVVDSRSQCTYAELDAASNTIAHRLIAEGVQPNEFVCIMLPRVKEFIASVLGIMKAGAAYVPIDMEYPEDRKQYMLEDSEAKVVITEEWLENNDNDTLRYDNDNLNLSKPSGRAYMIYTSGTTGKPKGVMVPHRALMSFITFVAEGCELSPESRIDCHSALSFDASVEDMYPVLTAGGRMYIVPEDIRQDLPALHDYIVSNGITGGSYTTQVGQMLVQEYPDLPVDYLVMGGERMTVTADCNYPLFNAYGPTEFTVDATYYELEKGRKYTNIPIGRPLANSYAFIVDSEGHLLPEGVAGELCLAGDQLSAGYWKREELTREKFVDATFIDLKMYHTGDLCRWNEEGQLEYMGRIDNQVKLRGFRIELGEIESAAMKCEGMEQAVALVRNDQIVLYYTGEPKSSFRKEMEEFLPDYMVPSVYMQLDNMPLTPNGKINHKALPEPDMSALNVEIVAPETEMEQRLLEVVAEVLKQPSTSSGQVGFGVTTNLLTVGLTSLSAMRLSILIQQRLEVTVPTKTIMQTPTIREMAGLFEGGEGMKKTTAQVHARREYYPLTENQRGVYVDWEMNRDTTQYNIPDVQRFDEVDADTLQAALEKVLAAHPYLKMRLVMKDGEVMQQRRDDAGLRILSAELPAERENDFFQKRVRPFDLFNDDLCRFEIYTQSSKDGQHKVYLFMDIHHIIYDGGSAAVFLADLHKALSGEELKAETYTAYDCALDEKKWAESGAFAQAEAYYDRLIGDSEPASFPASLIPDTKEPSSHLYKLKVEAEEIAKYCRANGLTESAFFMAVTSQVLHRVLLRDELFFTTIYHGRDKVEMQNITGMFVKTLPFVTRKGCTTFKDTAKEVMQQYLDSQEQSLYGYTRVVERHRMRPDIMLMFQLAADQTVNEEKISIKLDTVKVPLSIQIAPVGTDYLLALEYDGSQYCVFDIMRLADAIRTYARHAVQAGDTSVKDIKLITPEEKESVIALGMGEKLAYDREKTFVDQVMLQAQEHPDTIAVVDGQSQYTYGELDAASNTIAHRLIAEGVQPDEFVCIMLPRVKEFVASVLGVMKAGAAYVPVDMEYPEDRKQYMMEDSEAKVVITEEWLENDDDDTLRYDNDDVNLSKPSGRAYMIYTSGSTGRPKGVVQLHRSLAAFIAWRKELLNISTESIHAQHASFSFDASLDDLVCPLAAGGQVHILKEDVRKDMDAMHAYFKEHHVTGLTLSTQLGMAMINTYPDLPLQFLMMGGEKMLPFKKTHIKVINGYGPTEFTVCSSYHIIDQDVVADIPIGRPVPNTASFILDSEGHLLPEGVPGELCLVGDQIAEGYWHREDLTAKSFTVLPNPEGASALVHSPSAMKMYHTGDLCRWNEDGQLEYIGRIDNQVKLRGFRIELGEVESAALKTEGVMQAVALVKNDQLLLYYTSEYSISEENLSSSLSSSLPEYMVPSIYVHLDTMPLTPNGKINRKALPEPVVSELNVEIVVPESEMEQNLFDIAAELLKHNQFGVTTNLLTVGLTSLTAMRLSAMIQQKLEVTIPTKTIMLMPTIREMASQIENGDLKNEISAQVHARREYYPLTENQRGVYMDWEMNRDTTQYNIPNVQTFDNVDADTLQSALEKIVDAHPILKARLAVAENEIAIQRRDDSKIIILNSILADRPAADFFQKRVRPFDLFNDDLCRLEIYTYQREVYLFMDCHHIIYDGGSLAVFMDDLHRVLSGEELKAETYTAFDRALDEKEMLSSSVFTEAEQYMDNLLGDFEVASYPHSAKPDTEKAGSAQLTVKVKGEAITQFCKQHAVTLNSFFMTATTQALHRLLRLDRMLITSITSGRDTAELQDIIGMFVQTLPVVTATSKASVIDTVNALQRQYIETQGNGIFGFTRVAEKYGARAEIMFMYQGGVGPEEKLRNDLGMSLDTVKVPLTIMAWPQGDDYVMMLEYDSSLYSAADMTTLAMAITCLAEHAAQDANAQMATLPLVGEEERQAIIAKSAGKRMELDFTKTYLDHFIARAAQCPDSLAVADGNSQLTYRQLENYSNRIAHLLLEKGVKKHDFIAVMIERSKEFPACVFGIHKAGGAYLPLDIEYPNERLQYMLEDSGAHVLITTHAVLEEKRKEGSFNADTIIYLDDMDWENGDMTPVNLCTPDCYTYIIYTSGSTGKPKGVVLHHKGLLNYIFSTIDELHLTAEDRISSHRSFSFDSHIEDLYAILLLGGSLHIMPEEIRKNLAAIYDFVVEHRITGGGYTTSIATMLANTFDMPVRYLSAIGEKLMGVVSRDAQIINAYGPTECTDHITIHYLEKDKEYKDIPIGHVIANNWCFIVDAAGQLVPMGASGELCIAGIQVGVGYWKLPERTAQSFVDCPFVEQNVDGTPVRMYHTGDLARYNEQGELECLGRIDNQVKLRGYRVELGEIETEAMKVDGIQQAVAMIRDINADKHLVLYYTVDDGKNVDEAVLDEFMKHSNLPSYMVPEVYMFMEAMPRTPNGKINRRALPEPNRMQDPYVAPESRNEKILCKFVGDILGVENLSVTQNLTQVGMNSIMAMRISMLLQKQGFPITMGMLAKAQNIRQLSAWIETNESATEVGSWLQAYDEGKDTIVLCCGIVKAELLTPNLQHWTEAYNIYVLQPVFNSWPDYQEISYEQLLDRYLGLLKENIQGKIQAFFGFSFGGELAFHLAKRWNALCGQLPMIMMGDTFMRDETFVMKDEENDNDEDMRYDWGITLDYFEHLGRLEYQSYTGRVVLISAVGDARPRTENEEKWSALLPEIKIIHKNTDHMGVGMTSTYYDTYLALISETRS